MMQYILRISDAIHYKAKENHQYQTKVAYVVLGVTMDGNKGHPGRMDRGTQEQQILAKCVERPQKQGSFGRLPFCVDGLKGLVEAIGAMHPHSQVQRCIVHQIRSCTRFVSYKDIKPLIADLKKVYTAVTEDEALET